MPSINERTASTAQTNKAQTPDKKRLPKIDHKSNSTATLEGVRTTKHYQPYTNGILQSSLKKRSRNNSTSYQNGEIVNNNLTNIKIENAGEEIHPKKQKKKRGREPDQQSEEQEDQEDQEEGDNTEATIADTTKSLKNQLLKVHSETQFLKLQERLILNRVNYLERDE